MQGILDQTDVFASTSFTAFTDFAVFYENITDSRNFL